MITRCRSGCSRVKTYIEFEVIDIMGDNNMYPTFLGIDWVYENYAIIDLKKELMIFEVEGTLVIQPLDTFLMILLSAKHNSNYNYLFSFMIILEEEL